MTREKDKAPLGPVLATMVTVEPGRWVAVHTIERPGEGRMVVEIFHDNDGPIELGVYEDGAARFEGRMSDYPADGWRTRVMPYEDSLYQQMTQIGQPADALSSHPREGQPAIVLMDNSPG